MKKFLAWYVARTDTVVEHIQRVSEDSAKCATGLSIRKAMRVIPENFCTNTHSCWCNIKKTLELLELNLNHPFIRLHKLQGQLEGLSSVSINKSYRIVLEFLVQGQGILLVDIGYHDAVY